MLTSVNEAGHDLSVTLDEDIALQFKDLQAVNPIGRELVFGPFSKFRFEWEPAEGGRGRIKEYDSGEVKIVAAPG